MKVYHPIDVKLYHVVLRLLPVIVPSRLWDRVAALLFKLYLLYATRIRPLVFREFGSAERLFEYSWVLANLKGEDGSTILDVGCGDSLLDYELIRQGFKVYAIDLDCHPALRKSGNLNFVWADITQAPFKNDSFDWIVAVSAIEHIEDGLGCMSELRRVLKESGTLIVSVPIGFPFYDSMTLRNLVIPGLTLVKEKYYFCEGNRRVELSKSEINERIAWVRRKTTDLALLTLKKDSER